MCGSIERSEQDTKALVNPILLVEVLSESTAAFDKGKKFETCSQLPSLREYVLVEQDRQLVQTFALHLMDSGRCNGSREEMK